MTVTTCKFSFECLNTLINTVSRSSLRYPDLRYQRAAGWDRSLHYWWILLEDCILMTRNNYALFFFFFFFFFFFGVHTPDWSHAKTAQDISRCTNSQIMKKQRVKSINPCWINYDLHLTFYNFSLVSFHLVMCTHVTWLEQMEKQVLLKTQWLYWNVNQIVYK